MPDDVNEIGADERVVEIEMERLWRHLLRSKAHSSLLSGKQYNGETDMR